MKCIYCNSQKASKVAKDTFFCSNCQSEFDTKDIEVETGKKSKSKRKFTGRRQ